MPRPKDPSRDPEHDRESERGHGREHDDERERPHRHRAGRDRIVHLAIIERKFAGGPPPTNEAYARALQQWHHLPGAVMRPPTDVSLTRGTLTSSGGVPADAATKATGTGEQKA